MVDHERVERLLARVSEDLRELARHRGRGAELLGDRLQLAAVKYLFITAIEGCGRIAHHLIASERWLVAEGNADAVRRLGAEGVLTSVTAGAIASAVGFRNVLVHQYVDVDDEHVLRNLERLGDLERFVVEVARWLSAQD